MQLLLLTLTVLTTSLTAVPLRHKRDDQCKDAYKECDLYKNEYLWCTEPSRATYMKTVCAESCGFCQKNAKETAKKIEEPTSDEGTENSKTRSSNISNNESLNMADAEAMNKETRNKEYDAQLAEYNKNLEQFYNHNAQNANHESAVTKDNTGNVPNIDQGDPFVDPVHEVLYGNETYADILKHYNDKVTKEYTKYNDKASRYAQTAGHSEDKVETLAPSSQNTQVAQSTASNTESVRDIQNQTTPSNASNVVQPDATLIPAADNIAKPSVELRDAANPTQIQTGVMQPVNETANSEVKAVPPTNEMSFQQTFANPGVAAAAPVANTENAPATVETKSLDLQSVQSPPSTPSSSDVVPANALLQIPPANTSTAELTPVPAYQPKQEKAPQEPKLAKKETTSSTTEEDNTQSDDEEDSDEDRQEPIDENNEKLKQIAAKHQPYTFYDPSSENSTKEAVKQRLAVPASAVPVPVPASASATPIYKWRLQKLDTEKNTPEGPDLVTKYNDQSTNEQHGMTSKHYDHLYDAPDASKKTLFFGETSEDDDEANVARTADEEESSADDEEEDEEPEDDEEDSEKRNQLATKANVAASSEDSVKGNGVSTYPTARQSRHLIHFLSTKTRNLNMIDRRDEIQGCKQCEGGVLAPIPVVPASSVVVGKPGDPITPVVDIIPAIPADAKIIVPCTGECSRGKAAPAAPVSAGFTPVQPSPAQGASQPAATVENTAAVAVDAARTNPVEVAEPQEPSEEEEAEEEAEDGSAEEESGDDAEEGSAEEETPVDEETPVQEEEQPTIIEDSDVTTVDNSEKVQETDTAPKSIPEKEREESNQEEEEEEGDEKKEEVGDDKKEESTDSNEEDNLEDAERGNVEPVFSVMLRQNFKDSYKDTKSQEYQNLESTILNDVKRILPGNKVKIQGFSEANVDGNPPSIGKTKVTFSVTDANAMDLERNFEPEDGRTGPNGLLIFGNTFEEVD